MTGRAAILGILVLQGVSALVFVATLLIPVLGVPVTYDWRVHEAIEIGAAVGPWQASRWAASPFGARRWRMRRRRTGYAWSRAPSPISWKSGSRAGV